MNSHIYVSCHSCIYKVHWLYILFSHMTYILTHIAINIKASDSPYMVVDTI